MSQYQAAYNYAEEAINQDECALQCALGCKKTCHSYVFEDDTCNFIKTDIQFKEPKPFVLLTGNCICKMAVSSNWTKCDKIWQKEEEGGT